jgi:hypothetical protein
MPIAIKFLSVATDFPQTNRQHKWPNRDRRPHGKKDWDEPQESQPGAEFMLYPFPIVEREPQAKPKRTKGNASDYRRPVFSGGQEPYKHR